MNETSPPEPLIDPVADRLGYRLRRASSVMMARLGASLAPTGLRPVEATILILIGANPRCTQSDIGRSLGIKRANMVPLIAGLVEKSLVTKSRVDGRTQALSLTDDGETRCLAVNALMDDVERQFEQALADRALKPCVPAFGPSPQSRAGRSR